MGQGKSFGERLQKRSELEDKGPCEIMPQILDLNLKAVLKATAGFI